jgi:hypothetical protein
MSLTQVALYGGIALGAGVLLFGLDRLGLWLERHGWLYYRRRKPSRESVGNALMELQSFIAPQARDVIEARRQDDAVEEGEKGERLTLQEHQEAQDENHSQEKWGQ